MRSGARWCCAFPLAFSGSFRSRCVAADGGLKTSADRLRPLRGGHARSSPSCDLTVVTDSRTFAMYLGVRAGAL